MLHSLSGCSYATPLLPHPHTLVYPHPHSPIPLLYSINLLPGRCYTPPLHLYPLGPFLYTINHTLPIPSHSSLTHSSLLFSLVTPTPLLFIYLTPLKSSFPHSSFLYSFSPLTLSSLSVHSSSLYRYLLLHTIIPYHSPTPIPSHSPGVATLLPS